jgi:riboflavin transporter FmnP
MDRNINLQNEQLSTKEQGAKSSMSRTKKIVGTAIFAALAYVVSIFEFPIFPATPFLKLDFSAVFILLAGFIFGLPFGIGACAIKEFICFITKSSTGGVGEIANFIVISGYILIPTLVYMRRKGFKTVVFTLILACIIQVILALLANRFVNFPLYMGDKAPEIFNSVWQFILFFNLIKSIAVSLLTIILYKRLSGFIKRI